MLKLVMKLLDAASERLEAWAGPAPHAPLAKPPNAAYRAYTKEFDVIVDGAALATASKTLTPEAPAPERESIDLEPFVEKLRTNCKAMSDRLRQTRTPEERADTFVTLLFDQSGSLRAGKIYLAMAEVAEALADALSDADVAIDVLGFTTVRWKGGKARLKWLEDGGPSYPGRLNDLLHIVHTNGTPGPHHFAAMRNESLFKENVDGEALDWACSRALENTRSRKVVIVISDGAPVDDSTLMSNWPSILHDHIKQVANDIAASTNIMLGGIGVEHNVQTYYPNHAEAKPIERLADVAPDFVGKMIALAYEESVRSP
jgi:cobaltochelatase CobT